MTYSNISQQDILHSPYKNFLVDLDNTLIFTDAANNAAYLSAANSLGFSTLFSKHNQFRITRTDLTSLSESVQQKIIIQKQKIYHFFLNQTILNEALFQLLKNSNRDVFLVSNADENRASSLIEYHHLHDLFKEKIFCPSIPNKYEFSLKRLNLLPNSVLIFDDDKLQLQQAAALGLQTPQLYLIGV